MNPEEHIDHTPTPTTTSGIGELLEKAERIRTEHIQEGIRFKELAIVEGNKEKAQIIAAANEEADHIKERAAQDADQMRSLAREEVALMRVEKEEEERLLNSNIANLMKMEKTYRETLYHFIYAIENITTSVEENFSEIKEKTKEIRLYSDVDFVFQEEDGDLKPIVGVETLPDPETEDSDDTSFDTPADEVTETSDITDEVNEEAQKDSEHDSKTAPVVEDAGSSSVDDEIKTETDSSQN